MFLVVRPAPSDSFLPLNLRQRHRRYLSRIKTTWNIQNTGEKHFDGDKPLYSGIESRFVAFEESRIQGAKDLDTIIEEDRGPVGNHDNGGKVEMSFDGEIK